MTKLIVFGSARVDAFMNLPTDQAEQLCSLDTKKCVIELSYSAKLPLNDVEFLVGGNGANVAVGTKRLGLDSHLAAELGEGPLADFAMRELKKEIDMSLVSQTAGVRQGFGAVIVYQGERTILSYYSPKEPPFPKESCGAEWFYLTSVGERFETYYEEVYKELTHCNPKLVFNPGGRQISKGLDWMRKFLEKTHLVMVNREEAEAIVGKSNTHGKDKELLDAIHDLGPELAVITDGSNGSFARQGENYYKAGVLPIDSIERTGAGDSYSAGCMTALILGKDLREAMLWGTVNAASVIGYVGPERGLLTSEQLPEWLERAKSSGLTVENF